MINLIVGCRDALPCVWLAYLAHPTSDGIQTHGSASLHRIIFKPQRQHMYHQPGQQVGNAAQ